jgi:hypothetical protein
MGTGDVLQNLANEFSEYYGLAIVKIPFAEVSRKFVKLYNFVFAPQHGEWLGKLDQEWL